MPALDRAVSEAQRLDSSPTLAIERLAADDCRQASAPLACVPTPLTALPHSASSNLLLLCEAIRRPAPHA
jgi:hypothetical protein